MTQDCSESFTPSRFVVDHWRYRRRSNATARTLESREISSRQAECFVLREIPIQQEQGERERTFHIFPRTYVRTFTS